MPCSCLRDAPRPRVTDARPASVVLRRAHPFVRSNRASMVQMCLTTPVGRNVKTSQLKALGYNVVDDDRVSLIHGSCFDVAYYLVDACATLIVIDPPYGMTSQPWDKKWTKDEWARVLSQVWRLLARGGRLLVFGKKEFFHEVYDRVKDDALGYDELVWVHDGKDNKRNPHQELSDSERIGVFYRKAERQDLKLPDRVNHSDVLYYSKDKTKSMKPPGLMRNLIRRYSREGDLVVDMTMHRNVTGVAAVEEDRKFVGIERDAALYRESLLATWGGNVSKSGDMSGGKSGDKSGGALGDESGDESGKSGDECDPTNDKKRKAAHMLGTPQAAIASIEVPSAPPLPGPSSLPPALSAEEVAQGDSMEHGGDGGCTASAMVEIGVWSSKEAAVADLDAQIAPMHQELQRRWGEACKEDEAGIHGEQWHEEAIKRAVVAQG
jgi:site-specific DNA-methyltransferase (adenine-specific)